MSFPYDGFDVGAFISDAMRNLTGQIGVTLGNWANGVMLAGSAYSAEFVTTPSGGLGAYNILFDAYLGKLPRPMSFVPARSLWLPSLPTDHSL